MNIIKSTVSSHRSWFMSFLGCLVFYFSHLSPSKNFSMAPFIINMHSRAPGTCTGAVTLGSRCLSGPLYTQEPF